MGVRFRLASTRFWADQSAIITVQMVMLSVLIFGGMGLMMDFGRAYSAHSQMQGYIDQVALAAAQELDGQSDAITRATTAANAVQDGSVFVTGGDDFEIADLVYMSAAPTDANGEFSPTLAATHATTIPEKAKYVLAIAKTKSVAINLLNVGSGNFGGAVSDFDVATSAVATSKRVICGGTSTLVMCNPFETHPNSSWSEEMENSQGYRMRVISDITDGSKPSNFSGAENRIRLGLLKSPDALLEIRNIVCSDTSKLPGYSTSSKSLETLKDMCMLATVNTGMGCINDTVSFKAAPPETITTGLGVIFDMYDGPMADILTQPDIAFTHNLPASLGLPTTINRSDLFYPDLVPAHGRMSREEFSTFLDDREIALGAPCAPFNFICNIGMNAINDRRTAYGPDSSIDSFSRLNYVWEKGMRSEWGPAPVRACLEQDSGLPACTGVYPSIYDQAPGSNDVDSYVAALYLPYSRQVYQQNNPGLYANWWDVPAGVVDTTWIGNGRTTYYDLYSEVERAVPAMQTDAATEGHRGRDATDNPILPDGIGQYGMQTGATNFNAVYGSSAIGSVERRKQRVTVVNCEAAEDYASATGSTASGFGDTYVGDVVDVIDIHLITPPQVEACSPALSLDPEENNLCANENVSRVELDVEIVDLASQNETEFDARFYAVLVH